MDVLLEQLIDYAGVFPPARLPLAEALANYRGYLKADTAWMLGAFLCPASRLGELGDLLSPGEGLRLSVICDRPPEELERGVADLGDRCRVVGAELRLTDPGSLPALPWPTYYEIPLAGCEPFLEALAGAGKSAKIRTGGLEASAFPSSEEVAGFLQSAARHGVPFKATAGLHHAVRGEHAIAPPAAPSTVMHGFLNLFLAACLAFRGRRDLVEVLEAREFSHQDGGVVCRGELIDWETIRRGRLEFALCYGSCSFEEPVEELRALGWL